MYLYCDSFLTNGSRADLYGSRSNLVVEKGDKVIDKVVIERAEEQGKNSVTHMPRIEPPRFVSQTKVYAIYKKDRKIWSRLTDVKI